jgi:hypothetical protein
MKSVIDLKILLMPRAMQHEQREFLSCAAIFVLGDSSLFQCTSNWTCSIESVTLDGLLFH